MRKGYYQQLQHDWQHKAFALDAVKCAIYESEDLLQNACYLWFNHYFRERAELFAIPNGGHRNKAEALKFVATGTKAGVADMLLNMPAGRAVYIELKNRKDYIDPAQESFKARIEDLGFEYYMVNTFHQFACLVQYLFGLSDNELNNII